MQKIHSQIIIGTLLGLGVIGCRDAGDELGLGRFFNDGGIDDAGMESDAGVTEIDADIPDSSEQVDAAACTGDACPCTIGSKTCAPGDEGAEFVCEQGGTGPMLVRHACDAMSYCAGGACKACSSSFGECKLGERQCSADATSVMVCGCLGWQTAVECTSVGMVACVMPKEGSSPGQAPSYYCVNECGGRNIPLAHNLCDPDPNATCGYLVCDSTTFQLIPDHTGCLSAGTSCSKNTDCKSCACVSGICIGNTEKSCDPLCQ